MVLLALGFGWSPRAAAAQGLSRNVSNLDGSSDQTLAGGDYANYANAFTTGGSPRDQYSLNHVTLDFEAGGGSRDIEVYIVGVRSNGTPGTNFFGARLTGVSFPSGVGQRRFNASGTTLRGGTTYFVTVHVPTGASLRSERNNAQSGSTGWEIADALHSSTSAGQPWGVNGAGLSLRFAVDATLIETAPDRIVAHAPTVDDETITITWDKYVPTAGRIFRRYRVGWRN